MTGAVEIVSAQGRDDLDGLLAEARAIGHREAWLDTTGYMAAARALCAAAGFEETGPYPESENDPGLAPHLVYMRRAL